jgi:uncharacterized protein
MKLPVQQPWYDGGLSFQCTQCGNCCTGGPGYVWISPEELGRLAAFLNQEPKSIVKQYCRVVGGQLSLKEYKNFRGEYDCVFLKEHPLPDGSKRRDQPGKRTCTIYPVRPLQCRTWPFWDGNLASKESWDGAGERCPGLNRGRSFSFEQIERYRTAEDWPERPPSSEKPAE